MMKCDEIAERIAAHLKRFEGDPVINARDSKYRTVPYWNSSARRAGSRVAIVYVSYQGNSILSKADAEKYLEWLDAGNVGKHWQCFDSLVLDNLAVKDGAE